MSFLIPGGGLPEDKSSTRSAKERFSDSPDIVRNQGFKQVITFAVAILIDSLQVAFPPLWIPLSIFACLIFFGLWGWRLEILGAFIPELIPGVAFVPSWVAIAFLLSKRPPDAPSSE